MKLSTKGRYGLRALIDLEVYTNIEHININSIAKRQNISVHYLEQVFSTLKKAGIVKSIKGAQGGYILANTPNKIKVGTILRALEGDLSIIDIDKEKMLNENSIEKCIREQVWDKMTYSFNQLVDSVTLEDLAEDYRAMNGMMPPMYYI